MYIFAIFLFFVGCVILPLLLWKQNKPIDNVHSFDFGEMYVPKKVVNGGPNPCDHSIGAITEIEISLCTQNLYVSR